MKKIPVEIRNQVIELRRNGLSYPQILEIVHLSKSTISLICNEVGLGKVKEEVKEKTEDRVKDPLYCIVCGKELTGRQTMYCSKECKRKDYTAKGYHTKYSQKKDYHGIVLKYKLIISRGGKCEMCGYDKNIAALQFHHIDPSQKLFTLDSRTIERMSDEDVINECNKCKLLCSNCHHELHYPEYTMDNYRKFKELSDGIIRRKPHELENLDVGE